MMERWSFNIDNTGGERDGGVAALSTAGGLRKSTEQLRASDKGWERKTDICAIFINIYAKNMDPSNIEHLCTDHLV